ncbi:hypothetical protein [Photobacterium sp. GB-72]|uniref:hypothetical protein n=1 Tax=Photobacterium sp. GB-72 TaxID=2022105 RepID=UPI000D172FAA|nr:hypothetical protein [Photobacterium sp. GB-72]PSV31549.1 hypothetical protein C9J40_08865 [Photobacterium sp. GB-72]
MVTIKIINQVVLLFGGTAVLVVGLSTFLANIWTKRIVNGELAAHKRELQKQVDDAKRDLQREMLRHEAFTSISKEKYQDLFEQRIKLYQGLILVKKKIDDASLDNADTLAYFDEDPRPFAEIIQKINSASRDNPMLMSNELAKLSNQLYEESAAIFAQAKIDTFYAEQSFNSGVGAEQYQILSEVEDSALAGLYSACGETYNSWNKQLETDVSKIRESLDFTDMVWRAKY